MTPPLKESHNNWIRFRGSLQDDARFYVVRHNRLTGETQYIGCEDRDGCTQFVVEIED